MNKIYPLAPLKQPRYTHTAIFYGGNLYLIGGRYFG